MNLALLAVAVNVIVDGTIVNAQGAGSMMDLIAGRVRDIRVHIRQRAIDPALRGDYENDAAFRERFQAWVNALWAEKDADVGRLRGA